MEAWQKLSRHSSISISISIHEGTYLTSRKSFSQASSGRHHKGLHLIVLCALGDRSYLAAKALRPWQDHQCKLFQLPSPGPVASAGCSAEFFQQAHRHGYSFLVNDKVLLYLDLILQIHKFKPPQRSTSRISTRQRFLLVSSLHHLRTSQHHLFSTTTSCYYNPWSRSIARSLLHLRITYHVESG